MKNIASIVPIRRSTPIFSLILIGLGIACFARFTLNYPICKGDEGNYVGILYAIKNGIDWPVSGPVFLWINQWITCLSGMKYEETINFVGIFSTPVVLLSMYSVLLVALRNTSKAFLSTLLVFISSYFLGPLIEARPQQLGQVLVLAGTTLGCLNRSDPFRIGLLALIVTATAMYHILSFVVLCGALSLIVLMKHSTRDPKDIAHLMPIVSFIPGVLLLIWPSGPYAAMIRDIVYVHFKVSFPIFYFLIFGLFLSGFFLLLGIKYTEEWWIWITETLKRRLCQLAPSHLFFLMVFVSVFFLILQYVILPADHKPIGIQEWRFYLLQLGNLIFLILYCWGFSIAAIKKASGLDTCDSEPYFSLSIVLGLLALLSLIVRTEPLRGGIYSHYLC